MGSRIKIVTFKVEEHFLEVLDSYARSNRKSRSEVIREAIKEYLERRGVHLRDTAFDPHDGDVIVLDV